MEMILNACNINGKTAINLALRRGYKELVSFMVNIDYSGLVLEYLKTRHTNTSISVTSVLPWRRCHWDWNYWTTLIDEVVNKKESCKWKQYN